MADLSKEEQALYKFLLNRGTHANQEQIQESCKFQPDQLSQAINGLIQKNRLEIFHQGANIVFQAIAEHDLAAHKILADLSHDEGLVYQSVDRAGDNGIWMGTIRRETSLPAPKLKKTLKALQLKKLIKSFKSFGSKSKLLYIKFDLQPNKKLCGGVFWDLTTNTYDVAFVDLIKKFFSGKITSKVHATTEELRQDYITELREPGLAQVDLETEDVQKIINILIYDGEVEPVITSTGDNTMYRPSYLVLPELKIAEVPCIRCPVAKDCSDSGDITPETCAYFQQWLDF